MPLLFVAAAPLADAGVVLAGVATTSHPTSLRIDRSDGESNVLSWVAPSHDNGLSLVGYWLVRSQGDGMWAPNKAWWIPAGTTSYVDTTMTFERPNMYYVRAVYEDADGVRTESGPSAPAYAYEDVAVGPESWICHVAEPDVASKYPALMVDPHCTDTWT